MINIDLILPILIVLIASIIGPVIVFKYKNYLETKKKENYIIDSIDASNIINNILEELKILTNADRIWVTQFHNGGNFFPTGKSMAKFSVTYEQSNPLITLVKDNFKNIPVSLFSRSLDYLYKNDEILIYDYNKDNNYGLDNFFNAYKAKSSYIFALKNINNKFIGLLGIEYCSIKNNLTDEQLEKIRRDKISLGTLIGEYLNKV